MTNKTAPKKNLGGAPRKEIDYKQLDAIMQFKVTKGFVADYFNISEDTLETRIREHANMTFSEYNKLKLQRTGIKLQQKAIEAALSGNTPLMIFALKNIAGWSDNITSEMNHSGQIKISVDDKDL
jgi:hypothetical protein